MLAKLNAHPHIFRQLCLALVLVILLGPVPYWLSGIGQTAATLPAQIGHQADGTPTSSPKAQALHRLTLPMRIQRMLIFPLLMLAFQLSGGSVALKRRLEQRIPPPALPRRLSRLKIAANLWRRYLVTYHLLAVLGFILVFNLALDLLYLPFNFYRGFILAHQFGLSTQTAAAWLVDWVKSVLIGLAMGGLLWAGFFGLMRRFPRRWPVPAGAAMLLLSFVFTLLTPILITPLFYHIRPLDDPHLYNRIMALTDRAGMHVDEIYVIDASAKTTTVNAYFTGFGNARRIVLYDTLLSGYTPNQIEVVLAHEMGHWYYRHVLWSILGYGAAAWVGLFGLRWLLQKSWRPLGLTGPADVAGLPYILAVVAVVSMLAMPVENTISRFGESQADRFALDISRQPEAYIELFEQFARQNLSMVDAPAWEKFLFYTHPPIVERIRRAQTYCSPSCRP